MDTLTAARAQMELSLAFHMIFAALGIGMPLLMIIAEGLWLRTRQQHYLDLAHKWGKQQYQISEYENGNRRIYAHDLPVLAKALNVPISYFFQDEAVTEKESELEEVLLHEFRTLSSDEARQFVVKHLRDLAQLLDTSPD